MAARNQWRDSNPVSATHEELVAALDEIAHVRPYHRLEKTVELRSTESKGAF